MRPWWTVTDWIDWGHFPWSFSPRFFADGTLRGNTYRQLKVSAAEWVQVEAQLRLDRWDTLLKMQGFIGTGTVCAWGWVPPLEARHTRHRRLLWPQIKLDSRFITTLLIVSLRSCWEFSNFMGWRSKNKQWLRNSTQCMQSWISLRFSVCNIVNFSWYPCFVLKNVLACFRCHHLASTCGPLASRPARNLEQETPDPYSRVHDFWLTRRRIWCLVITLVKF